MASEIKNISDSSSKSLCFPNLVIASKLSCPPAKDCSSALNKSQPQRCLAYVKATRPESLEDMFQSCFETMWLQHLDLSKTENMLIALLKVFNKQEADETMKAAQTPEVKQSLNDATKHAVEDLGAFGCPWFWVQNGRGNAEPFFGSDRFHYVWDYLEIPYRDLELQGPISGKL